jgi:hypothetical protein
MPIQPIDFYRSSNGDRWRLIRDSAGKGVVRHEPNLSSGGQVTETGVDEFLDRSGVSPQAEALRATLEQWRVDDGSATTS